MKKQLLFIGTILISAIGFSQTLYTSDGSLTGHRKVTLGGRNLTFTPATSSSEFFIHGGTGFVGIGKINPTSMLDVDGQIIAVGASFPKSIPNGTVFTNANEENKAVNVLSAGTIVDPLNNSKTFNFFDFHSTANRPNPMIWFSLQNRNDIARFVFSASQDADGNLRMLNKVQEDVFKVTENNNQVYMTLPKEDSFIGIGTTSFVDGTDVYRLSVNGAIRADRVRVYTTWADYVFEKDYKLPTLAEVEKHIAEKGHLHDIPSAKEVEQNGIELGEMNKLLLQKVEELTLYIIEMNKKIEILESQIIK